MFRFFFQAEDGIRDYKVTGVQTCALPILQSAQRLIDHVDAEVASEVGPALAQARKTLASADRALSSDSPLQTDTRQAMREVARAAQAFRVLADYLERHPEALLVGKKDESGK